MRIISDHIVSGDVYTQNEHERAVARAVAAEREECAKIADNSPDDNYGMIAEMIRARGKEKANA